MGIQFKFYFLHTHFLSFLKKANSYTMAARRARRRVSRKRMVSRKRRVSRKKRTTRRKKVVRKRRRARKVSVGGSRAQVWRGTRQKVKTTGQTKSDLMKNKRGKVVSKKANSNGKRVYKRNGLHKWTAALMKARKKLGLKGFVLCKKGTKLYNETMKMYKA